MNLQKLITQRESHRRLVKRHLEKIEEAKKKSSLLEFNAILESIESKVTILETLNEKILSQMDVDGIEQEIIQAEEFSLELEIELRQLRKFRDETSCLPHDTRSSPVDIGCNGNALNFEDRVSARQTVSNTYSNSSQYHRLPKLSLPTFNGDILLWQSFWDSYESTIHQNNNLTDVQKFSYLKSQLECSAARVIDGFALTNANYTRAIDLLKERFGQQHKITHATMQALLKLPAPSNNVGSLRKFYDKMETYIRGLEAMGQYQETYGNLLIPVIIDKLPGELRKHLARVNGDNNWQLEDLRHAIDREINIMEAGATRNESEAEDYEATASFFTAARSRKRQQQERKQSTTQIVRKDTVRCSFCEDSHKSAECRKYTDTDSRLNIVKQKQLCFNCLRKHPVAKCNSSRRCQICNRKHHTAICGRREKNEQSASARPEITVSPEAAVLHSTTTLHQQGILLKTAVATVTSGEVQTDANILFDEGAQKSFITETLATELKLARDRTETVYLSAFGSTTNKIQHVDVATVYLLTSTHRKIPIRVLIVPHIATPIDNKLQQAATKLPYLRGLKLAHPVTEDSWFSISMLIGADFYWDIIEDHTVRGDGPTAVKSKIGYLLSGPIPVKNQQDVTDHIFNVMTCHMPADQDLERFWNLESMGITPQKAEPEKTDYFKQYQQTCIEFIGDKYSAKLPWKLEHPPLPTNYEITKRRTEKAIRRISSQPNLLEKYGEITAEQERQGLIERVESDVQPTRPVHYIPHHPVKKNSSTTPIRIVYDCSCRRFPGSPSLNDCLESTPPVLNELTPILVRFRLNKYAVATDIEKAFLHVGLDERDRDVTRFLWLNDVRNPESPLCTYRFKAVLFGAICSPFMLSATILKHLELNQHVHAAGVIKRDLYVDNVLSSFQRESDLLTYFHEARKLMSNAGMNLRSWTSNCDKLRSEATTSGVIDSDSTTKVLGMRWDPKTDLISFTTKDIPILEVVTKRSVLRYSSQIYDPLGLLTPVTVRAKIFLQDLWKQKHEWDVPLPESIQKTWNQLAMDLTAVTRVTFQRQLISSGLAHYSSDNESTAYLHIFVDASVKSYGAAAYISNQTEARLVMAKNKVAPLKSLTLPQLELMAALVGARLAAHLQSSLQTSEVIFWSDSQIVLHWLATTKQLNRFVRNRVDEIHQLTGQSLWKYCPTDENPADLLTRGISADNFINNQLWERGPIWLTNRKRWPTWEYNQSTFQTTGHRLQTTLDNVIQVETVQTTNVVAGLQCTDQQTGIHAVIDSEKYSSYAKLLHITAYVLRYIRNSRRPNSERSNNILSARELQDAEDQWLHVCQAAHFQKEIANLKSDNNRTPLVRQLRLFLDATGHIRCGGRIHNALLRDSAKFPYLLPRNHDLTRLIILDAHENQLHSGVNATITHLRQKFWIPAIRQCVKSVIRKCVKCTRVSGKPYRAPDPPPLPKIRVEEAPPFSITGVDFTGALYVKDKTGSESKVYICLFTCASTRAVHLEVVPDLSADSFLQAFRRFVSRKSLPRIMISDNATTYMSAANQLKQLFRSTTVQEAISRKGTEWQFLPKRAPWYGGFWERLIGLTKTTLKKILGQAFISMETLQTLVTEIEAVMNDRPLTYVSSDFEDVEPLTPAHLLYGRRMTSLPHADFEIEPVSTLIRTDHSILTKQAKIRARITKQFWTRWKSESLTALRQYHRTTGSNSQHIRVGDVVQIHDDGPRIRWKLGVIQELITGNDGLTRAAKIKTKNGLTTRPIVIKSFTP